MKIVPWKYYGLLLGSIVCFVLLLLLEEISFHKLTEGNKARHFEETLQRKELKLYGLFDGLEAGIDSVFSGSEFSSLYYSLQPEIEGEGLVLFIFDEDDLRFWTDNSVGAGFLLDPESRSRDVVKIGSAWYVKKERMSEKWRIAGLIKVKNEYGYQNR